MFPDDIWERCCSRLRSMAVPHDHREASTAELLLVTQMPACLLTELLPRFTLPAPSEVIFNNPHWPGQPL